MTFEASIAAGATDNANSPLAVPQTHRWSAVCGNDDRLIAIARSSNKMAYSNDGIIWKQAELPISGLFLSATSGRGKTIGIDCGTDHAIYSSDGEIWQTTKMPSPGFWSSVTFGKNRFVAVNWSQQDPTSILSVIKLLYGGKSSHPSTNDSFGSVASAYSTEGVAWQPSPLPQGAWTSVAYGNGHFVAVAQDSDSAAYSEDGLQWHFGNLRKKDNWSSVSYGNGRFAVISKDSNSLAYSSDGINWSTAALPSSQSWSSLAFGNGRFVVIARNSSQCAYSNDAIRWDLSPLPIQSDWRQIAYGCSKFIIIGDSTKALQSKDGINWTEIQLP